jgi:CHAD domain-containing protein
LRDVIQDRGSNLRRDLERNSRRVEDTLKEAESDPKGSDAIPLTMAKAISLSSDLSSPARLTRNNLHSYRLKVKELRDTLQLSVRAGSSEFLEKLGEVKDAIGEWHDWEELVEIATKALDHGSSCMVIKRLKIVSKSKYDKALLLAERLRSHYLKIRASRRRGNRSVSSIVTAPVIDATSSIAGH